MRADHDDASNGVQQRAHQTTKGEDKGGQQRKQRSHQKSCEENYHDENTNYVTAATQVLSSTSEQEQHAHFISSTDRINMKI